jgi:hypothetical protein
MHNFISISSRMYPDSGNFKYVYSKLKISKELKVTGLVAMARAHSFTGRIDAKRTIATLFFGYAYNIIKMRCKRMVDVP